MLVQLVKVFKVKPSVAALGLLATSFKSCDAALNFVSDASDDNQLEGVKKMLHPYIGCLALSLEHTDENHSTGTQEETSAQGAAPPKLMTDDLEANIDRRICYICH